jgi:hypothetical protein
MKTHWIIFVLALSTAMILSCPVNSQLRHSGKQARSVSKADSILFNSLVAKYARSIDQGDTVLASETSLASPPQKSNVNIFQASSTELKS